MTEQELFEYGCKLVNEIKEALIPIAKRNGGNYSDVGKALIIAAADAAGSVDFEAGGTKYFDLFLEGYAAFQGEAEANKKKDML